MSTAPEIITVPIARGMVNSFILRDERVILVDAAIPRQEGRILSELEQHGLTPEDVSLILITHGHSDHYGSAAALKTMTGAPIAVHERDADAMSHGSNAETTPVGWMKPLAPVMAWLSRREGEAPSLGMGGVSADILVGEELDLRPYGVRGKAIHTPGHTAGSLSIVLEGGEIIVGDLIVGGIPRRKRPTPPILVSDRDDVQASLQRLMALSPTLIYASHGGPFTPDAAAKLLQ